MNKFSIYLGDIDPNNEIISAIEIRRKIMFHLLMWDSIILSDSQYLTDPRIHLLMEGFSDKTICKDYSINDIEKHSKGFEHLIHAGLVEIAYREQDGQQYDMHSVWSKMIHNTDKKVPYLPKEQDYACYLDSLGGTKRTYKLENMQNRFKHNLNLGMENGGIVLNNNNETDCILKKMFEDNTVLFRNIFDFIKNRRENKAISVERYYELYNYVYSCYSINISAETDCYINTKFKNIPFHLESGTGDFAEKISQDKVSKMRPTWGLNPYVLDFISFEDFVQLRKDMQFILEKGTIMKYITGVVSEDEWKDTRDTWEDFTKLLEMNLKLYLQKTANMLNNKYIEEFANEPKFITNPKQFTMLTHNVEFVKNAVCYAIPIVGEVMATKDLIQSAKDSICFLSRRQDIISMINQRKALTQFLNSESKVITNYSDNRNN